MLLLSLLLLVRPVLLGGRRPAATAGSAVPQQRQVPVVVGHTGHVQRPVTVHVPTAVRSRRRRGISPTANRSGRLLPIIVIVVLRPPATTDSRRLLAAIIIIIVRLPRFMLPLLLSLLPLLLLLLIIVTVVIGAGVNGRRRVLLLSRITVMVIRMLLVLPRLLLLSVVIIVSGTGRSIRCRIVRRGDAGSNGLLRPL